MDKKYSFVTLSIAFLVLTFGCGNKMANKDIDEKNIAFTKETNLKADSVKMDLIIKPGTIYHLDPFIIVSDVSSKPENHFHVFNKNLKYLYSFCRLGEGAEECLMPTVVSNTSGSTFIVRDHASDVYHTFSLNADKAEHISTFTIKKRASNEFLWEICNVSDSVLLAKGMSPRKNIRRLINVNSGITLDTLPSSFHLSESMGKDYYSEYDDFWMTSNGDRFVNAYFFINRIEFGKIHNNSLSLTSYIGVDSAPDFFLYNEEPSDDKYEFNVDYNTVYYEWLTGSSDKVYAGYFGQPWGEIYRHSSFIESYTYDGKPDTLYSLDIPIANAVILEKENKIIGINPDRSEDYFYIYHK